MGSVILGVFLFGRNHGFGPDWSQVHWKRGVGPWTCLLAVFSVLYGLGLKLRFLAYRHGFFKRKSLPGFVVSVGNLTAGGTGKTPATVMLAKWALNQGYRVAVLSRGYGGRYKSKVFEVSDGENIIGDPTETGDEPYLLAKNLPGVPVVLSKKRYLGGLFAHKKFGTDFFVLDDGFQHLELERDLDLVLMDAADPFGNGHSLPWGPLREPLDNLARADAVILTRFDNGSPGEAGLNFLRSRFSGMPLFRADHLPKKVVLPCLNEIHGPEFLKGKRVLAFGGIARPDAFRRTLTKLGAHVVCFKGFGDHYRYTRDEIQVLIRKKEECGADYILTTEKDWMRVFSFMSNYPEIGYLCIEFDLLSRQDEFFGIIKNASIGKATRLTGHI